jgi:hypothetical protein
MKVTNNEGHKQHPSCKLELAGGMLFLGDWTLFTGLPLITRTKHFSADRPGYLG